MGPPSRELGSFSAVLRTGGTSGGDGAGVVVHLGLAQFVPRGARSVLGVRSGQIRPCRGFQPRSRTSELAAKLLMPKLIALCRTKDANPSTRLI